MRPAFLLLALGLLAGCGGTTGNVNLQGVPQFQCPSGDAGPVVCKELANGNASIAFGDVPVGLSVPFNIILANTGRGSLTVSSSAWSSDSSAEILGTVPTMPLAGLDTEQIPIRFAAQYLGSSSGTLTVNVGGSPSQVTLTVTANATGSSQPMLSVTDINFGDILQQTTVSQSVMLTNNGNIDLDINGVTTLPVSTNFTMAAPSAMTVPAGNSMTLSFSYTPPGKDLEDAGVTLFLSTADGPDAGALTIFLQGESLPALSVTPNPLTFSNVNAGLTTTKSLTVSNGGVADLVITSAALGDGGIFFSAGPLSAPDGGAPLSLPATLHPSQSATVAVSYITMLDEQTSTDSTSYGIVSNDPMNPTLSVPVTGSCPMCVLIDNGCTEQFPHRLWPSSADVSGCFALNPQGQPTGPQQPTTGANSEDWVGDKCGYQRDFATAVGIPIQFSAWGNGCEGGDLYHISFNVEENLDGGFQEILNADAGDTAQCPDAGDTTVTFPYTPLTNDVRMLAVYDTTGEGYLFSVCSQ